ncbi:putative glycosyltransferase EpsE [Allorhodopirellula heiligendammensis]|uniref:Glycosyltransferase EpsE n=2 Tax=Allorhodopirellula heiligendammensis TaxID=2714739 RepID=A0A5C6C0K6_9BACT|nr:putative glycosyltransferase EpsE [Allorhodopirellula heiligendammensis]
MAVHNMGDYLRPAIASVLSQSFRDFEFIIINDGSVDSTGRILRSQSDARIRVLTQENQGLTVSLNRGTELAKGKYIARMDGDDISLPFRFEEQVEFLESQPNVVAAGGQVLDVDSYGGYLGGKLRPTQHEEIDRQLLLGVGDVIVHPSLMVRATALRQVHGYDEQYRTAQDLDLYLRLAETGRLANLESHVLMYRQHAASTNSKKYDIQIENRRNIMTAAYERRQIPFTPGCLTDWTPVDSLDQSISWAWRTLAHGERYPALRHALNAWLSHPLSKKTWKLMACVARGY